MQPISSNTVSRRRTVACRPGSGASWPARDTRTVARTQTGPNALGKSSTPISRRAPTDAVKARAQRRNDDVALDAAARRLRRVLVDAGELERGGVRPAGMTILRDEPGQPGAGLASRRGRRLQK